MEAFLPQVFVTVGGGDYPAYHKFESAGQATITVPLKQEAINNLVVSELSSDASESVIGRYEVYESAQFPAVPTAVTALALSPSIVSLATDAAQQFVVMASFADGTTGEVTSTASWNLIGGAVIRDGLYVHGSLGTVRLQALLHTEVGWYYSNIATITSAKSSLKAGTGQVNGVVLSHYTGLGLGDGQVTAYHVSNSTVAYQFSVFNTLGNYARAMDEGIYHFEGSCAEHRSVTVQGGILLVPSPPALRYYTGQVKDGRPLENEYALRPNDPQAPWVVFVEPVADTTVNTPLVTVTAIDTDKFSELQVALFSLNAQGHDVNDDISSTGFYRDTWGLQLGLNTLRLYTMDTEGNASERSIQVTYDPAYVLPEADSDGDGMDDAWESAHGLNPNSAEGDDGAHGDLDSDGLTNIIEYQLGSLPNSEHSDADSLPDRVEFDRGTDLLEADTDGDGLNDDVDDDPLRDDRVKMMVTSPANGISVRGDAVTLLAELSGLRGRRPGGVRGLRGERSGDGRRVAVGGYRHGSAFRCGMGRRFLWFGHVPSTGCGHVGHRRRGRFGDRDDRDSFGIGRVSRA